MIQKQGPRARSFHEDGCTMLSWRRLSRIGPSGLQQPMMCAKAIFIRRCFAAEGSHALLKEPNVFYCNLM